MKSFHYTYIILLLSACLVSCEKKVDNGLLDGQWQLMEVSRFLDGNDTIVENKKDAQIYWRIHMDMLLIYTAQGALNGHSNNTVCHYDYGSHHFNILESYIHFENRDSILTPETTALVPMGIDGNAEDFHVDKLNHKRMELSNANKKLVFRKF